MYAYATNFKKIELILDNYEIFNANLLKIYDNTNLVSIDHCKINEKNIEIVLTEEINIKNQYIILYDNHTIPINYFPSVFPKIKAGRQVEFLYKLSVSISFFCPLFKAKNTALEH